MVPADNAEFIEALNIYNEQLVLNQRRGENQKKLSERLERLKTKSIRVVIGDVLVTISKGDGERMNIHTDDIYKKIEG